MKRALLFISLLIFAYSVVAEPVTQQQAFQKARQFMKGKSFNQKNLRRAPSAEVRNNAYYVFNVENNGGFVIVSGDDRTEAILGYADKGNLDLNRLPDNLKVWLGIYEQAIKSMTDQQVKRVSTRGISHDAIAPLLGSQWGQGAPYNAQCPIINEMTSPTGCVATAMAQLMYYHKWPESVDAIPGYNNYMWGMTMDELPATTFDWNNMKTSYGENEQADEVAKLMRYCGQAVEMLYGTEESGVSAAIDLDSVLIKTFDYAKSLRFFERTSHASVSWEEIIYRELEDSRPVFYDAFNGQGVGHAFICDGYDNGYFHINWGWSGECDGYFLLSLLDPNNTDDPMNGYSVGQRAIIGLQKDAHGGLGEVFDDGCFVYKIIDDDKVWLYSTTDFNMEYWVTEKPYDTHAETITIPSTVTHNNKEYKVTELGHDYAFNIHWDITFTDDTPSQVVHLVLPETLEKIYHINFFGPEEITIPKNVYDLGIECIDGQYPLKRILVDENNQFFKSIDGTLYSKDGETFFRYPVGKSSETFVIADGVKKIMGRAFSGCLWIKNIVLPASVEEIGDYAFCGMHNLESYNIPEGVTYIGGVAFSDCPEVKKITIPNGVKGIGPYAFSDCPMVEEITIPGSVEYIACEAFSINENAWSVDYGGYPKDGSLKKVTVKSCFPILCYDGLPFCQAAYETATLYVPLGAKQMYQEAWGWSEFKHIEEVEMDDVNMEEAILNVLNYSITDENTVAITDAKRPLYGHITIPSSIQLNGKEYHVTEVKTNAFINQTFSWLTLSEGIVSIGANAIGQNWSLERIDLPSTFRYYDESNGFVYDNPALAEITLADNNPYFTLKDGVLYTKDMKTLVAHPAAMQHQELVIPQGVETIQRFSLADCKYLKSVTIPSSVKAMDWAFYGLIEEVSLTSLTIQQRTPPAGWTFFGENCNVYANATLYVPLGSKVDYENNSKWGKFQHIEEVEIPVEIATIAESTAVSFGSEIDSETTLANNIIDNTYYNMDSENGDGYDATEGAIVLNSTVAEEQMADIQNAELGDATVCDKYNGIIFRVPAGGGTITVDVKTIGSHMLNVQVGNAEPTQVTKSARGTVDVDYKVLEPTYVYLYATTGVEPAPARAMVARRGGAGENSLLLYGYQVQLNYFLGDSNADGVVSIADVTAIINHINGDEGDFNEAAADVNGDGIISIADVTGVINLINQ